LAHIILSLIVDRLTNSTRYAYAMPIFCPFGGIVFLSLLSIRIPWFITAGNLHLDVNSITVGCGCFLPAP